NLQYRTNRLSKFQKRICHCHPETGIVDWRFLKSNNWIEMSLKQLIRLFLRYQLWIIAIPVLVAILVYFLSQNLSKQYESKAVIFTNPTSNQGATDGGVGRVDFYTSNNLFDNLMLLMKSRETLQDASLKLLALHLSMEKADPEIITSKSFEELKEHISPALREKVAVIGDAEKTYENLKNFHLE